MKILFNLICGPLLKPLLNMLKMGAAFMGGVQYQKGKQAKKDLKQLTKSIGQKNEIQNRIDSSSDDDVVKRLYANWTRDE